MKPSHIPVFDGHNDTLTRLWLSDHPDPVHAFIHERLVGHLDLKRCQEAGFIGGMFAIFLSISKTINSDILVSTSVESVWN